MEHHVYFWLKDEHKNADDRKAFEAGLSSLFKLKGLQGGFWAIPAKVMERPVVDQSWDYALTMTFESAAAQDAYQEDPDHHVFIDSFKPWWARVEVRDLEKAGD
ncbi:MAG: Dabb family protein [Verrucomicrobia bacterium]|nr:MAG: Dabb family protein [Verrucomicrobiota bacterium]TAE86516.1 MAG: Dabb family protein [Verrucomicrobiota bacterium]TAF24152.1 MAG: Dabb family protein [Verrucomicrobiota bacterium]